MFICTLACVYNMVFYLLSAQGMIIQTQVHKEAGGRSLMENLGNWKKNDVISCSISCMNHPECNSFTYSKINQDCVLGKGGKMSLRSGDTLGYYICRLLDSEKAWNKKQSYNRRPSVRPLTEPCKNPKYLRNGKWKVFKMYKRITAVAKCHTDHMFVGKQRKITCDPYTGKWSQYGGHCRRYTWNDIDWNGKTLFIVYLPFKLIYAKDVAMRIQFNRKLVITFHNSQMPSYMSKFIIQRWKVEVVLFNSGRERGRFVQKIVNELPLHETFINLAFHNTGNILKFRLSKGERQCHFSKLGFLDGVDKLTLHNHSLVKNIKVFPKSNINEK